MLSERLVLAAGLLVAIFTVVVAAVEEVSAIVAAIGSAAGLVLLIGAAIWGRKLVQAFRELDDRVGRLERAIRKREG